MKSPLGERPIFHHLERRVETPIFRCVLDDHLLVCIERAFLEQGIHTSWETFRSQLSTHQVVTVRLPTTDGQALTIRRDTRPEQIHKAAGGNKTRAQEPRAREDAGKSATLPN